MDVGLLAAYEGCENSGISCCASGGIGAFRDRSPVSACLDLRQGCRVKQPPSNVSALNFGELIAETVALILARRASAAELAFRDGRRARPSRQLWQHELAWFCERNCRGIKSEGTAREG